MSIAGVARSHVTSVFHKLSTGSTTDSAAFLAEHPHLVTHDSVEFLAQAVREYVRTDVGRALQAGETACVIADRVGTAECKGLALRAKANALWFKGQCRPAVDLLDKAAALFESAGRFDEVGRTLSTSIQPLIMCGEYARAIDVAGRARELFTQQRDQNRLARLELNVANIYYRQEHYSEALEKYQAAYTILLDFRDVEAIAVALHNMAVCLISLDDFERSMKVYAEAREFFTKHDMPMLVAQADYNIAYLYFLRGHHEQALSGLAAARKNCELHGDSYHTALCDLDESEVYLDLNLHSDALAGAQRAIAGFDTLGMGYESSRAAVNAGVAAFRNRDLSAARDYFKLAKDGFSQERHESGIAQVKLYEAILLTESGDTEAAHELCLAAKTRFQELGLFRRTALCDVLISRLLKSNGDLEQAEAYCREALSLLEAIQAPSLAYQAYMLAGNIEEARSNDSAAMESYQQARRSVESIRSGLHFDELKVSFMSDRSEVYTRLAKLCLKKGHSGPSACEALSFVEQAKSRSMLDLVAGTSLSVFGRRTDDQEHEDQTQAVSDRLNWYYRRIEREYLNETGVQPDRIATLVQRAQSCESELLNLRTKEFGCGVIRKFQPAVDSSIQEAQRILGRDRVLLEYFELDERLMAAVVTHDGVEIVPLASVDEVRSRVRMLRFQLSKFRLGSEYTSRIKVAMTKATMEHLQHLHKLLIQPLRRQVAAFKHLVIVPHGVLHSVPMHALHDGSSFVCDSHTLSYSLSAGLFAQSCTLPDSANSGTLVMAHGDSNTPWITKEAESVAKLFPDSTLLTGDDASRVSLETLGPQHRTIHVAAHGHFRRDNPVFSAVRLSDAHFSLYDLYKLRLPVDLLTLSGCATGMNLVAGGDELIGLTRGLLSVGARTLLLTIWDVHDESTGLFMSSFYKRFRTSNDKSASVREAMLEVRDEFAHPFYWAPFTLVGKC